MISDILPINRHVSLELTFQDHPRSNLMVPLWFPVSVLTIAYSLTTLLYKIWLQNLSDLDFDITRSIKVKCGVTILPIYGLLLMFKSKVWANLALLRDPEFEMWLTLTVTCQSHSRLNVTLSLDSHYLISYMNSIQVYTKTCYSHMHSGIIHA